MTARRWVRECAPTSRSGAKENGPSSLNLFRVTFFFFSFLSKVRPSTLLTSVSLHLTFYWVPRIFSSSTPNNMDGQFFKKCKWVFCFEVSICDKTHVYCYISFCYFWQHLNECQFLCTFVLGTSMNKQAKVWWLTFWLGERFFTYRKSFEICIVIL